MTTPPIAETDSPTTSVEKQPAQTKPSWFRRLLSVLLVVVVTLLVLGIILFGVIFWFWQQSAQMVTSVYGGPLPRSAMPIMGVEDDSHRHRLAVVVLPDQQLMMLLVQSAAQPSDKPVKTEAPASSSSVDTQEFMKVLAQWSNDKSMDPTIAMYLKQAQTSSGIQQIKLGNTILPALSLSSLSMDVSATSTTPDAAAMDSLITILPASGAYPETLVLGLNPQGKMTPEMMAVLLAPMPRFADTSPATPQAP